jgi:DNA-binding PadR family transcriptional regulator
VLQVETGSLYPALHRLERQSWVQSEWKQSESRQRARYYRITASGKKQLVSDLGRWARIVEVIGSVMHVKPEESEL